MGEMSIDELAKRAFDREENREKARKIFKELEGMNIFRAQELLKTCSEYLTMLKIKWE